MLNTAIVGLGWWGKTLVNAVHGKSDVIRFTAGATGRRHLAEDFAKEKGLALADSLEEVLADPAIEAVVLATPHLDHERQVVAAAKAGKHVFVEKPFTLDKASAERAAAAMRDAGTVLAIGHNRRFHPHMDMLRTRLKAGDLGTIVHCEGTMAAPSGLFVSPSSWRVDPEQSPAGGMTGLGIHIVDSMIDLMGPIADVTARSVHRASPAQKEDTTSVLLTFKSGATGYLSAITVAAPTFRFAVYGAKGVAEISTPSLDHFRLVPTPDAPSGTGHGAPKTPETSHIPGVNTVFLELEAFARAVAGGTPYPISAGEMVHATAVLEAITRSARTRETVAVP